MGRGEVGLLVGGLLCFLGCCGDGCCGDGGCGEDGFRVESTW